MADNTAVNSQITDAVTQADVSTVSQAPAVALGMLSHSLAFSTSIMFANAVSAQQQLLVAAQAATNQGVLQIYDVARPTGTPPEAEVTPKRRKS